MAWEPIAPGLSSLAVRQSGAAMLRCVAVDGPEGRIVISPIRDAPEAAHAAISDRPVLLLAPNQYHNMGLRRWAERHRAPSFGSDAALPRLRRVGGVEARPAADLPLPPGAGLLTPPGTRNGEIWLRREAEDGVTWVVGDAFFAVPAPLPDTFNGWFLRLTLGGPGLRIGQSFLWIALSDRRAYRDWLLQRLEADRPVRLVPLHGDPVEGPDLWERLREIAARRL